MDEKTKTMLFLGACFTGLATTFFMSEFVGRQMGQSLGFIAGWVYGAFAFQPTMKRAVMAATGTVVWALGIFYVWHVRHDVTGFAVLLICAGISYLIARPFLREKARPLTRS